ncbi:MAG: VWA domain-containing protein [Planctomycetota bacterium]|jgi:Ca-activated chloride channel family protein
MIDFLSDHFAPGPVFGWLCLASLLLIPVAWWRFVRNRGGVTVRYSSAALLGAVGSSWAMRLRFLPTLLRSLALVALAVALARPQSPGAYRDTAEGIAIQMVLDISGSMSEEDFLLDGRWVRRLDAVKKVFKDFTIGDDDLKGRDQDLIGMTTFAMFAESPCPLTLDHATLAGLLDETEIPGWVDGRQVRADEEADYTSLGDAIVLATDDLRRAGEQAVAGVPGAEAAKSRVMILLTDGADNPPPFRGVAQAPDPEESARIAARLGIKIYTIGAVGSQRRQGGLGFFGARGMQVDERALKRIAQLTGGKYFRATDTDSLVTIYEEIDALERRTTGERTFKDNVYAARVAMLVALSLLMTELLLVNTRFRRVP